MRVRSLLVCAIGLLAVVFAAGCGSSNKSSSSGGGSTKSGAKTVKVAVLFPGRINDKAFNQTGYEGLQQAKAKLPIKAAYSENVGQADFVSTMRNYAQQGFALVYGFGFQFSDAAAQVAPQFPKTKFIVNAGAVSKAPNLASTTNDEWQSFYLAGIAAAKVSKTHSIAYIGGVPIPVLVQDGNGFAAGAKSVDSSIKVKVTYTGSFDDIAKGQQTALSLIDQGADVVLGNANIEGIGVIHAAQSKKVFAMGAQSNQTAVAPATVIGSGVVRQGVSLQKGIELVVNNTFQPKVYSYGLKDNSTDFEWNPAFQTKYPDAVKAIASAKKDLLSGKVPVPSTKQ